MHGTWCETYQKINKKELISFNDIDYLEEFTQNGTKHRCYGSKERMKEKNQNISSQDQIL